MICFEFTLYVENQTKSKQFYADLFDIKPILDVPNLTEFQINNMIRIGLIPTEGRAYINSDKTQQPSRPRDISCCMLYLKVKNPIAYINKAIQLGALEISPYKVRNWGDKVGYLADFDGHIIAFAKME